MAGSSQQDPNGMISGINMTPLVDIMLVLLIIFLVTAKLTVTPPEGLPMQLPKSATGTGVQVVFAVSLASDGRLAIDGEVVGDDAGFLARARAAKAKHPDLRAVVQADGKVLHERVVHALDLLAQADISQIAFAVQRTQTRAAAP